MELAGRHWALFEGAAPPECPGTGHMVQVHWRHSQRTSEHGALYGTEKVLGNL